MIRTGTAALAQIWEPPRRAVRTTAPWVRREPADI